MNKCTYFLLKKGYKIRFVIFEILLEIYKNNISFENIFNSQCSLNNFSKRDKSLINNVCLNSMRYKFHVDKIIIKYLKKKSKKNQYILLLSAITQIVFLDFKEYAVIDNSVEIAKKINVYPSLINAVLKKICAEKIKLKKIMVFFSRLFKRKVDVAKLRETWNEQKEHLDELNKQSEKKVKEDFDDKKLNAHKFSSLLPATHTIGKKLNGSALPTTNHFLYFKPDPQ